MVRRVVLDAMYFRNAKEHELARLRERGLSISVSIATLGEVWANSVRNSKPGLVFKRAQLLGRYLDEEQPIMPVGIDLRTLVQPLRRLSRRQRDAARSTNDRLRGLWAAVVAGKVSDDDWRIVGMTAQQEMDRDELVAKMNEGVGKNPELRGMPASDAVGALLNLFEKDLGAASVSERTHAYGRIVAFRVIRSVTAVPQQHRKFKQNDSEDMQLLMQVAVPAFVATMDGFLLDDVDASGTYQTPWVRRLDDLLTSDLPSCEPWGPAARKAAREFRRPLPSTE